MTRFFSNLRKIPRPVLAVIQPSDLLQKEGLGYWRELIYSYMLGGLLVLGFVATVPSVWYAFSSGQYGLGIFDSLAYLGSLSLLFLRNANYNLRAMLLLLLGFSIGVAVFFATGDEGAGLFWMFAVPPLASLLLGIGGGLFFFGLNIFFVVVTGYIVANNMALMPGLVEFSLASWTVYSLNFLVTNFIVTVPLGALFAGLTHTVEQERKNKDFTTAIIETANVIFLQLDKAGNITRVNQTAEEITGYQLRELQGLNWFDVLAPREKYPGTWTEFVRLTSGGEYEPVCENTILTKRGEERRVLWRRSQIVEDGRITGAISFGIDITDRRKAEATIPMLYQAVESSDEVIFLTDAEGVFTYVNYAFTKLYGYTPVEVIGKATPSILRAGDREAADYRDLWDTILAGNVYRVEWANKRKDGSLVEVSSSASPIRNLDGEISGFLGVQRDITQRRRNEAELKQHVSELEAINEVSSALRTAGDLEGMLEHLLNATLKALHIGIGSVSLYDADREELRIQVSRGFVDVEGKSIELPPIKPGKGIAGEVFASGQAQIIEDLSTDPRVASDVRKRLPAGFNGVTVPIHSADKVQGVISAYALSPKKIGEAHLRLLTTLAEIAGSAIRRRILQDEIEQRLVDLEAIHEVSSTLRQANTLDQMLPHLLDTILNLFGSSVGSIWLYDPETDEVRARQVRGYVDSQGEPITVPPEKPGHGLSGAVFASGEIFISDDFRTEKRIPEEVRKRIPPGIGGVVVPIYSENEAIGVFNINSEAPQKAASFNIKLLITLAEIAGSAIQRTRLHERTERGLQRLLTLSSIDRAIVSNYALLPTLDVILQHVIKQLHVDASLVMLFNPATQTMESVAFQGFRTNAFEHRVLQYGEGNAGRAVAERRTVNVADLRKQEDNPRLARALKKENFVSYYGVPLIAKGEVKGVLEVFHRKGITPGPEWLNFLNTLAGQTAIAIDNALLFEDLQKSNTELALAYDAAIEGWSRALDMRDQETEGHTLRVTELTIRLASKLGIDGEDLIQMRRGALLHDIGKMGIPDSILLKPGSLNEEEWKVMRQHPVFARDLLAPMFNLRKALDIPYAHHEKWDGSGYPRGLAGEDIPLAARIFAFADVYDALTSDRPYRKAWAKQEALDYIREQAGTHFDPDLIKPFFDLLQ